MARTIGKMSWDKYTLRPVGDAPSVTIPVLIYGTAWKKERTANLVYQALKAGFRAVDTAAQPKHYREDLVGEGIRRAIKEGMVRREDLYVSLRFFPGIGGSRVVGCRPVAPTTIYLDSLKRGDRTGC